MNSNIDEVIFILKQLEKLRKHFKINMLEIENLAHLKKGQYARIINRSQKADLESIRDICKYVYNLTIKELLNLDQTLPLIDELPSIVQELTKDRIAVRTQEKLDLTAYLSIIIDKHYNINDVIENEIIRTYLPKNLKHKAIELAKTTLKSFVSDLNKEKTIRSKTYKLIAPIHPDLIETHKTIVDQEWLKDFEEKYSSNN